MPRAYATWAALTRATLLGCAWLVGCAGGATPEGASHPPSPAAGGASSTEARIHRLNARAREGAVVERRHGELIRDPYRALEKDTPFTRQWMELQTERTRRALAPYRDRATRRRLRELLSIGVLGEPMLGGVRVFYTKREGEREQAALFMADGDGPQPTPLIDPERYGERAALDWHYPSPDGRRVAFGISERGDERSTLHVLDVNTGRALPDTIERTKWARVAWLPDGSGFYYTRYPAPGEPGYDANEPESYFPRIFFHRLGTPPAGDPLVFGAERGTDFPSFHLSADGRWLTIQVFRGWSASDVYLLDRGTEGNRAIRPDADHPLITIAEGEAAVTVGRVHRDTLFLYTDRDAPRGRVLSVDVRHARDRDRWRLVVPEHPQAPIEGWVVAGDRLALHRVHDVRSRIDLFGMDGTPRGPVPLPARGSVSGIAGHPDTGRIAYGFSSYLHAPSLHSVGGESSEPDLVERVEHDVDTGAFVFEMARVRSADGTEIPVQLVRPAAARPDGSHPVLLTGYGGFDVSLLPAFTRNALHWVDRGGIYAVANLRGGGEYGEAWHRAGQGRHKPTVFEDFEAVLGWLGRDGGWSRPERIVITGRSNGGLLVGTAVTRVPHAFAGAAAYVGLYDMVRFDRFPPAEVWVSEYGDPSVPEDLRVLHGYSPYHRIRGGTPYPAVLIEAADQDTRVHWAHSTKLAARLQEATTSADPVLFYRQRELGHGAGTRLTDLVDQYARMYAFFELALARRR